MKLGIILPKPNEFAFEPLNRPHSVLNQSGSLHNFFKSFGKLELIFKACLRVFNRIFVSMALTKAKLIKLISKKKNFPSNGIVCNLILC
jgi:hypothetical protein